MSTKEVKNNKSEETNTSEEELYFLSYFDTKDVRWIRHPLLTKEQLFYILIGMFNEMESIKEINIQTEEQLNVTNEGYCPKTEEWEETLTTLRETLYGTQYQKTYEFSLKDPTFRSELTKNVKDVKQCKTQMIMNDPLWKEILISGMVQ